MATDPVVHAHFPARIKLESGDFEWSDFEESLLQSMVVNGPSHPLALDAGK